MPILMNNHINKRVVVALDGTAQFKKIQDAIDAVEPDTKIYIKPGHYIESIQISKNISMINEEMGEVIIDGNEDIALQITFANVNINNITIQNNSKTMAAIIADTSALKLQDCNITALQSTALRLTGVSKLAMPQLSLHGCHITQCAKNGILVDASIQVYLTHCTISNNGNFGIQVARASISIEHCVITNNKRAGLELNNKTTATITNTEISHNQSSNVIISGHSKLSLIHSQVQHSGGFGLHIYKGSSTTIQHSKIQHNKTINLLVNDRSALIVEDTKISDGEKGLFLGSRSTAKVRRCDIFNHQKENVDAFSYVQLQIEDSKVYGSTRYGLQLQFFSKATVTKSDIHQNEQANIFTNASSELTVQNCKIHHAKGHGIHTSDQSTVELIEAEVFNNEAAQIEVDDHSRVTIVKSELYAGGKEAIVANNNARVDVRGSTIDQHLNAHQLHIKRQSTLTIKQSSIKNGAQYGIFVEHSKLKVVYCDIVHHSKGDIYRDDLSTVEVLQKRANGEINVRALIEKSKGMAKLNKMVGLRNLKQELVKLIYAVQFMNKRQQQGLKTQPVALHSLFVGNPGTGKTTVANLLGEILYETGITEENIVVEVTRKDLVGLHVGHTEKQTLEKLTLAHGGVLFIDDAYMLCSKDEKDYGKEAIETIMQYMEKHRGEIVVIFALYPDEVAGFLAMNPGLQSRIRNTFYFDDYSLEEIVEIGYLELVENDYYVNRERYRDLVKTLYQRTIEPSNARWIRNFNAELITEMSYRVADSNSDDLQTITEQDLLKLVGNHDVNSAEKIDLILNELQQLTGLYNVKKYVEALIKQVKVDRAFADLGLLSTNPMYHMVFTGNPGTGKTVVAHLIAQLFYHLNILPSPHVKVVTRADLVGSFLGHTERNTKDAIKQSLGGVLFIDEAYQLNYRAEGAGEQDYGKLVVDTLLPYMENYYDKFIVIFAGYKEEMQTFLSLNPGLHSRIRHLIEFPDYTPNEIANIVCNDLKQQWTFDEAYLLERVERTFSTLPTSEQATNNARWARSFTQNVIQQHKISLAEMPDLAEITITHIKNETIDTVMNRYLVNRGN